MTMPGPSPSADALSAVAKTLLAEIDKRRHDLLSRIGGALTSGAVPELRDAIDGLEAYLQVLDTLPGKAVVAKTEDASRHLEQAVSQALGLGPSPSADFGIASVTHGVTNG
jgi:hypothetical protein